MRIRSLLVSLALLVFLGSSLSAQMTGAWKLPGSLTLDSNKPCTAGPHATYVQARFTNTSGSTISVIRAVLRGMGSGIVLAGGQDSAQYLAPLANGASWDVYWFIEYPCTIGSSTTLTAVADNGSGTTYGSVAQVFTTIKMISAQAGGNLIAESLSATTLGAISTISVTYSFGGVSAGDVYLVEPAGTNSFNAGCFQLLGSRVDSSGITAMPVGATNQLFFTAAANQGGSNLQARVSYTFRALCTGIGTVAKPFAYQQSGATNLKYSGNFDTWGSAGETTVPGATNPFTISKTVNIDTLSDGGNVTYTVTISNTSAYSSTIDSVTDVLPTSAVFVSTGAGGINASNSTSTPSAGATGTVRWRSIPGTYYTVGAGSSITLIYTVTISSAVGTYANSAKGYVGSTLAGTGSKNVVVRRIADVAITKSGPATANTGDTVRFVLTTSNAGPSAGRTIVVKDTLPSAFQFLSATRSGAFASGVVTFPAIDSLAVGASVVDTVVTIAQTAGTFTNISATSSARLDSVASNNNGSAASSRKSVVITTLVITITVTPDGLGTPVNRLAGTAYSQAFVVTNTSSTTQVFDVLVYVHGSAPVVATRDSITGTGITVAAADSFRISFPASTGRTYTYWYDVLAGVPKTSNLVMKARSVTNTAVADTGWAEVHRSRPALALVKSVSPSTPQPPQTDLTYQIQFSNTGDFAAVSTILSDPLPSDLYFKVSSVVTSMPSGVTGTVSYSSNGGASWTYVPVSGGCSAPSGYDGCVNRLKLVFNNPLPPPPASSSGNMTFIARIR